MTEPLTVEDRPTLMPIRHPDVYEFACRAEKAIWVTADVKLDKDPVHWAKLSPDVQTFISFVLAFFVGAESTVIATIVQRFHSEIEMHEARQFYGLQIGVETIHEKQYNLLINALIPDEKEQFKLNSSVQNVPCIRAKAQWARDYISNKDASLATRMLAMACVEQIFFSSSFAAIYWVKTYLKVLPGVTQANEYISRDEGLHCDFAIHLLNHHIVEKLGVERMHEIVGKAAEIEKEFVRDSLKVRLIGMSSKLMQTFVEYIADRLLADLGMPPLYKSENPFPFMEFISQRYKSNFFERRVTDYARDDDEDNDNENW